MEDRTNRALALLNRFHAAEYEYLGSGFAGVVFHDGKFVYKVHLPLSTNHYNEIDNILYLKQKFEVFRNRKHFYPLTELVEFEGHWILVYPYEESEQVRTLSREEIVSFLVEMWDMKIICKSITKENNFISVKGTIKLIDYEIEPYNDNLFLNVIARAWIQLPEFEATGMNYDKIKRSVINNFELPQVQGLYEFAEEVFRAIGSRYSAPNIQYDEPAGQPLQFQYTGEQRPAVSLLIKACIQDSQVLRASVIHLIGQLTGRTEFHRRILLLDLTRENQFLREYSSKGRREELLAEAEWLEKNDVIDEVILFERDTEQIERTNERWFGIRCGFSHTIDGIPVASQLNAFELVGTQYILQMDCDVMIGCTDSSVDYLEDKIALMESDPRVVTAGFPIYQGQERVSQPFIGLEKTVPPDPRCSLIHRDRLFSLLPLPNSIRAQGLEKSWYRSLEQRFAEGDMKAVHGGNCQFFYVHPPNYRKENRKLWWSKIKSVEDGHIPDRQIGEVEVRGNFFDWANPKRNEPLVVFLMVNDVEKSEWKATLSSILGQDLKDMGLVVLNNSGCPDRDGEIKSCLKDFGRSTFLSFELKIPANEALFHALHYYVNNPESWICLIREGDLLLASTVMGEVMNRMRLYGADVLIGNEFSRNSWSRNGLSRVNLIEPRAENAGLENGLQVFQYKLFDTLSVLDLKVQVVASKHLPGFTKIRNSYVWLDDTEHVSIMAPIVELAKNPIRFDGINLLRPIRRQTQANHELVYRHLQNQEPKREGAVVGARKTFLPNLNRIELDITYDCNLKCFGCNRSCTQAPGKEEMHLEQVDAFVRDSAALGKRWDLINILGGEPTLHPDFITIVEMILYEYVVPYSMETTLQVTSNGYGEFVQDRLAQLPVHPNLVVNTNSFKEDREVPYFTPFNQAPIDTAEYGPDDYQKGCWVTSYCGLGLNYLGYFPCGIAGGIERVHRTDGGLKDLRSVDASIGQKLKDYCKFCGNFTDYAPNKGDFMERAEKDQVNKKVLSSSWREIYKTYNDGK